jgi:hypothetical protein
VRTAIAETSLIAYRAMGPKLSRQENEVVAFLAKHCHRDYTRNEIAAATGIRLSSVCGRCNSLVERQALSEGPRRRCAITGSTAHPLRLAPAQADLF